MGLAAEQLVIGFLHTSASFYYYRYFLFNGCISEAEREFQVERITHTLFSLLVFNLVND